MKRPVRTHMFVDDPDAYDPRTKTQYCFCGLPSHSARHTLRQRDDDERAHEARRMGESR